MRETTIAHCLMILALIIVAAISIVPECEARGGRGRGGGTLGGIFGGWRKYKKPTSGGNSRRYNPAPVQPAMRKPVASSGHSAGGVDGMKDHRTKYAHLQTHAYGVGGSSHSKQQHMPFGGVPGGQQYMPLGSTYYASSAAIPSGAIYYAQPPMRSTGGGDFLYGMMAGHVMNQMLYGRTHITHRQNEQQQASSGSSSDGGRVIIINTGGGVNAANATNGAMEQEGGSSMSTHWPTDTDVPLAPYNATVTPAEATQPANGEATIFQRLHSNQPLNGNAEATAPPSDAGAGHAAPYGIVCMPMYFNETDPTDFERILTVEKTVCYPAPPPPPATMPTTALPGKGCYTLVEPDPTDPTKAIEVQIRDCPDTEPTQPVAGDIGDTTMGTLLESTTATIQNEGVEED